MTESCSCETRALLGWGPLIQHPVLLAAGFERKKMDPNSPKPRVS